MKNEGKKFEDDFKKSVPKDAWYYRLRDGTSTFYGGNDSLRFQATNLCDCEIYYDGLYLLELKSHLGKSLPHNQFKIKHLEELAEATQYGVVAGAVINMREVEQTYYLPVDKVLDHINTSGRKSIPLDFMQENGYPVKCQKKKVRYRYDIQGMLDGIKQV